MEEDLTKSRRNFVVLASVIIFYICSGITVEQINLLGNKAQMPNPALFDLSLILLFSYFFIRFHHRSKRNNNSEFQTLSLKRAQAQAIISRQKSFLKENRSKLKGLAITYQDIQFRDIQDNVFYPHEGLKEGFITLLRFNFPDEGLVEKKCLVSNVEVKWRQVLEKIKLSLFEFHFLEYTFPYFLGIVTIFIILMHLL